MKELLKIYYISSKIRTCFFYTNNTDPFIQKSNSLAIKLCFGEDFATTIYGAVSCQSLSEVPNKSIGVSSLYASKLGLKENEPVLISYCDAISLSSVQLIPVKEEDYFILLTCKSILEEHILNQVSVVEEAQILPLFVFSNIAIDVEIGTLESKFGQLEKFTEVIILHPSERISKQHYTQQKPVADENEKPSANEKNFLEMMIANLNNLLKNRDENVTNETVVPAERNIHNNLLNSNDKVKCEYKVAPNFMIGCEIPKEIQEKFVIVSNLWDIEDAYGPCSFKIFAKIQKSEIDSGVRHDTDSKAVKEAHEGKNEETEADGDENGREQEKDKDRKRIIDAENDSSDDRSNHLYSYVISFGIGKDRAAFCPPHVIRELGVYVGSRIVIEKADSTKHLFPNHVKTQIVFESSSNLYNCFWNSMKCVWDSARQTVINNIRFNSRINTLILGHLGAGKSFLLNDLKQYFSDQYIFCKMICCKSLRGKKMGTVEIIWTEALLECCCHEPSLLILDDLHALLHFTEDEGKFNKLYSNRLVDLISENLKQVQKKYNVSVIASGDSMSQLSSIVTVHGPRLFQNVQIISNLTAEDRIFVLKNLIEQKSENHDISEFLSAKISNATNGFNVEDLSDLVKKAVFHSLLRNESNVDGTVSLNERDFEMALSETTPLVLRGLHVKEILDIKWESVGGMTEPKKVLTEIFSWPSKYPKLLESCPLRVQRGVLLYGAPGTGKTLLAGALANHCNLNFISVKGPEVLSKYVGASEEGVRNLFVQAQKKQPCLLFFDEFDSLAPKRGHESTGVTDRVVNQLLTQLDGVETLSGVWVLAATSRPDLLDEALLRPGRLDKLVYCDIPNQEDRLSILKVLFENLPKSEDISLSEIAEKTEGYTGADLRALLYNAQMQTVKRNRAHLHEESELKIEQTDLLEALLETRPSLTTQEKLKYEKIYRKFCDSRKGIILNDFSGTIQRVTLA